MLKSFLAAVLLSASVKRFFVSCIPNRDVRVSVCVFDVPFHVVYFEAYFAPTSQSWISKKFRDSESLGGKCWKEVVSELNILLRCGLKLARKNKFVFCWFCLTKHGGNHASRWIRDLWSKGILLILAYL